MNLDTALNKLSILNAKTKYEFTGGNSTVYGVEDSEGNLVAIKIYKGNRERVQRMFERESSAMIFLNTNAIDFVPQFRAGLGNREAISYTWISGETPIIQSRELLSEILACVFSLNQLYQNNQTYELAIDAVLSGNDVLMQIKIRLEQFSQLSPNSNQLVEESLLRINQIASTNLVNTTFPDLTLSFSDVGAHNVIRHQNGKLFFIDLEFFGVDSLVKICADLFCHPRTEFRAVDIVECLSHYDFFTASFVEQLLTLLPAISLKWSLIVARREMLDQDLINATATSAEFRRYFDYLFSRVSLSDVLTFQEFKKVRE
jgi:hypothetical protein